MTEDLLKLLYSYKVSMDFKDKDFDGQRVQQYAVLMVEMEKNEEMKKFLLQFEEGKDTLDRDIL